MPFLTHMFEIEQLFDLYFIILFRGNVEGEQGGDKVLAMAVRQFARSYLCGRSVRIVSNNQI